MPYDETGKWDIVPYNSPVFPIHAALLYTSKVLFISGSGNCVPRFNNNLFTSALWDYQDNTFKVFQTPSDIFCSGHSFLPDGKLVVAGGTLQYDPFKGLRDTYLFDPAQEEWRRVQQMADGRWYPTLVTLGNGRVLAISGTSTTPDQVNRMTERYSKSRGWESLGDGPVWPLYPYLFLLADGRIFYSGGHFSNRNEPIPGWLDLTTNTFTPMSSLPPDFDLDSRDQCSSVLLPPAQDQKVMIISGGSPATPSVFKADLSVSNPVYQAANSLHTGRMHLNAVILPDRTVFVCGGSRIAEDPATAENKPEIYDPSTGVWTLIEQPASVIRLYHSIALLLPDGRVVTAGSNPKRCNDGPNPTQYYPQNEEYRIEIYSPPYLFEDDRPVDDEDGNRPVIKRAPEKIEYGDSFNIRVERSNRDTIKWIHLIRPMATTHSLETEQRLVDLPFKTRGGRSSSVVRIDSVPSNRNLLPPGWYMLFVVVERESNNNSKTIRIPSVSKWVRVT